MNHTSFKRQKPLVAKKWLGGAASICLAVWVIASISASAVTTNDVSTMFNSYSNVYYSLSGSNGYFKKDQTGGIPHFWEQAEEIECVIDAWEWTSNTIYKSMTTNLLNGFLQNRGTDWSTNNFNDDCMWACIAFARGYLDTGVTRYRDVAWWNFDMVYARSWDSEFGGGLYWKTKKNSKNACVNGPGGIAAFLLFQIYGDASYLTKANDIFNWERSVLFDPETGAVSDSIGIHGRKNHLWTYNQGTFIGLANFLGHTNDAVLAANYTKNKMTVSGILPQNSVTGDEPGFNAIFFRWMARFIRDRGLQSTYEPLLQDNANAAWNVRRVSDDLSWCKWQQPTPVETNLLSWECVASLEALLVVQPIPSTSTDAIIPMIKAKKSNE